MAISPLIIGVGVGDEGADQLRPDPDSGDCPTQLPSQLLDIVRSIARELVDFQMPPLPLTRI